MKLKNVLKEKSDIFNCDAPEWNKVKLGEPGWKERYYNEKFMAHAPEEINETRKDVVLKYTEGLCWVMRYFYQGVCPWQWFYPYHYAPFASDLRDMDRLEISIELGKPFKPFNQLMGNLPAASANALPKHYRLLMTDPNSPIIDFYPTDFEIDMNDKRFSWQGVAKLPFIDESRLLTEVNKVECTLTAEEMRKNIVMYDLLFVTMSHPLSPCFFSIYDQGSHLSRQKRLGVNEEIDPRASGWMNGFFCLYDGEACPPIFTSPIKGMENITNNQVLSVIYKFPPTHKHITRPPNGVIKPKKSVCENDVNTPTPWHEDNGRKAHDRERSHHTRPTLPPLLGKSAHRLIANILQLRNSSSQEVILSVQHEARIEGGILDMHSPYEVRKSYIHSSYPRRADDHGYQHGYPSDSSKKYNSRVYNGNQNRS